MRTARRRSRVVPALVSIALLGAAVAGTLWFVQFRDQSKAVSLYERITGLYADKQAPPSCERLGMMFLELTESPHASDLLSRLDREQASIGYDGSRNAVYYIHVKGDSRPCVGRAYRHAGVERRDNHSGFPDFLIFQKIDAGAKEVSLQFAVAKDERQRAAIERYGFEPGAAYSTTFEGPTDPFDLAGLARRARRK